MSAVNKNGIDIIRDVTLTIRGSDKDGFPVKSMQICYVTPKISQPWGLHQPWAHHIIFPSPWQGISATTFPSWLGCINIQTNKQHSRQPHAMQLPQKIRTKLPVSAAKANVIKLKQWLLDNYASNTFSSTQKIVTDDSILPTTPYNGPHCVTSRNPQPNFHS